MKPFFTVREMKRGDWGVFVGETCTGTHPTKEIAGDVAYELNGEYKTSINPLCNALECIAKLPYETKRYQFDYEDIAKKTLEAYK